MKNFLVGLGLMGLVMAALAGDVNPPTPVPEPGTLLLVALAAGVGIISRRRK